MTQPNDFFTINVGQITLLIAFVGLWLTFRNAHAENKKTIQADAADRQDIKTKMDLIYQWFQNNVVGRGENPRRHGEGD